MMNTGFYDVIVCGGGPSGVFAAIFAAKNGKKVCLVEKSGALLAKIYVSGGGRCNLTNAHMDFDSLDLYYPRGYREMRQILHHYSNSDIIQWFSSHGCDIKEEEDGRCFPHDDKASGIANILLDELQKKSVEVLLNHEINAIDPVWGKNFLSSSKSNNINYNSSETNENASAKNNFKYNKNSETREHFILHCFSSKDARISKNKNKSENPVILKTENLILATGNNAKIFDLLSGINIKLMPFVPSLYALKCDDPLYGDLAGITVDNVTISSESIKSKIAGNNGSNSKISDNSNTSSSKSSTISIGNGAANTSRNAKIKSQGKLLFTHDGISGPAVLNFTAYAAIDLYLAFDRHHNSFHFDVAVNWISKPFSEAFEALIKFKKLNGLKNMATENIFNIPKRFWEKIVEQSAVRSNIKWGNASNRECEALAKNLTHTVLKIKGKAEHSPPMTYAGGVDCKFVDMKTMQSKVIPHLYFCGELLNIDGITGGYNFQNAWSTGYIAGKCN